jgi:hypothetical protein
METDENRSQNIVLAGWIILWGILIFLLLEQTGIINLFPSW